MSAASDVLTAAAAASASSPEAAAAPAFVEPPSFWFSPTAIVGVVVAVLSILVFRFLCKKSGPGARDSGSSGGGLFSSRKTSKFVVAGPVNAGKTALIYKVRSQPCHLPLTSKARKQCKERGAFSPPVHRCPWLSRWRLRGLGGCAGRPCACRRFRNTTALWSTVDYWRASCKASRLDFVVRQSSAQYLARDAALF